MLGFKCNICPYISKRRYNLKRHYEKVHRDASFHEKIGYISCSICGKWFSSKETLKKHIYLHDAITIGFNCVICGMIKRENHQCSFKCYRCDRAFSTNLQLNVHMKFHNSINYVCKSVMNVSDLRLVQDELSSIKFG